MNIIIEVEVDGQKQYSTVKSDVTTNGDSLTVWDEHMFFELKGLVSQLLFSNLSCFGRF